MPTIGLARAIPIPGEYLEDDIRADRVCLLPAVCHATGIIAIRVDEDDETTIDAQEAWVITILVTHVGEVARELSHGRVSLAFGFMIDRPAECGPGGSLEQTGDAGVCPWALSPPRGDTH